MEFCQFFFQEFFQKQDESSETESQNGSGARSVSEGDYDIDEQVDLQLTDHTALDNVHKNRIDVGYFA